MKKKSSCDNDIIFIAVYHKHVHSDSSPGINWLSISYINFLKLPLFCWLSDHFLELNHFLKSSNWPIYSSKLACWKFKRSSLKLPQWKFNIFPCIKNTKHIHTIIFHPKLFSSLYFQLIQCAPFSNLFDPMHFKLQWTLIYCHYVLHYLNKNGSYSHLHLHDD